MGKGGGKGGGKSGLKGGNKRAGTGARGTNRGGGPPSNPDYSSKSRKSAGRDKGNKPSEEKDKEPLSTP